MEKKRRELVRVHVATLLKIFNFWSEFRTLKEKKNTNLVEAWRGILKNMCTALRDYTDAHVGNEIYMAHMKCFVGTCIL